MTPTHEVGATRTVRLASTEDISRMWDIDSSATKKFASIPELADLAASEESPKVFHHWLQIGRVYLAEDSGNTVGLIAAHYEDGVLYIAEIAVNLEYQARGFGALLLSAVFEWAQHDSRKSGAKTARVSLTTYPDVRFNGPWYRKHGFREVEADTIGPWHINKMTHDSQERGLVRPGFRRACMLWEANTA